MANQRSFVPHVQHNILVELIRTKEYDGHFCAIRQNISLRLYFGTLRKSKILRKKEMDELIDKKL